MPDKCPNCNTKYERLATHWANSSSCDRPKTPNQVLDILHGVLLVTKSLNERSGDRLNQITIQSDSEPKLKEFSKALGIYAGNISSYPNEGGWGDTQQAHELIVKPITEIQNEPDYSTYEATHWRYFYKALFRMRGSKVTITNHPYYSITVSKNIEAFETVFDRHYSNHKVDKKDGRKLYQIPYRRVMPIIESDWPSGWWNKL